ncbi:MAG: pantothenate kinase [Flavobacteriales bacterium]|nr:pantothenate kinase [Flavobacteriales bacterium]|tara:strand:- start:214 stop:921 length:708 start_codon:yes stop_codon:yes gene_type:complete
MNLIIDIGNTFVKYAVFSNNDIIYFLKDKDFDNDIANQVIKDYKVSSCIISSVREKISYNLKTSSVFELSHKTKIPFNIIYSNKETLGADRIAAIVGATELHRNNNILIIDAGTCITFDYIDNNSNYRGGRISPGIMLRYRSLFDYTSKLPFLEKNKDYDFLGMNTKNCIISGVQNGIVSEIQEIINVIKKENDDLLVIITGGDAFFFEKEFKNTIFADEHLLIKGLNRILEYNA